MFCLFPFLDHKYWRRRWHPTPVLLPEESHEWRSLVGCSPWGCKESDTTERLHFHFSLSCVGEGNGNPLQCSCLENLRDGGAWWAAVYGVAQSRTWLKWLSSSSSLAGTASVLQNPLRLFQLANPKSIYPTWSIPFHGNFNKSPWHVSISLLYFLSDPNASQHSPIWLGMSPISKNLWV